MDRDLGSTGTPHTTNAPSPPGQETYSAATPGKWGEAPASRVGQWDSPRALSLGQGAGRKKRIRGAKAFHARLNYRKWRKTLRTCTFTILASQAWVWPPKGMLPGPCNGLASLGDTPSWGGSFSSSARPDPRRVRAAGHPDLAVFLSVAEEAGSHERLTIRLHGEDFPGMNMPETVAFIYLHPSDLRFWDEPSQEMPEVRAPESLL